MKCPNCRMEGWTPDYHLPNNDECMREQRNVFRGALQDIVEINEHEAADPRTGCHGSCAVCIARAALGLPRAIDMK